MLHKLFIVLITTISICLSLNADAQKNWRLFTPSQKEAEKEVVEPTGTPILSEPRKEKKADSITPKTTLSTEQPIGNIRVLGDERVILLFETQAEKLKETPQISGFRIQIFFGSREESNKFRAKFLEEFPNEKVYVSYLAPNFRVRVGDYRNRFEAEKNKKRFSKHFPNCYIVPDKIELPVLTQATKQDDNTDK
ncbi:MAG: SPOR domain-containing protein [Luteibaculaceae bacterium]